MDTAEHIDALRAEGRALAEAARVAGLEAPVPACPGWQVRDLVAHVGGVHRWATAYVAGRRTEAMSADERNEFRGHVPADAELVDWYVAAHADLVGALEQAPPDLACWTFMPASSPRAFWARRQAHETTIHRIDAEAAAGKPGTLPDAELAADGIDELLAFFLTRPKIGLRADPGRNLGVRASDTGEEWSVRIGPDRVEVLRGPGGVRTRAVGGSADCALTGSAADLYLFLWNRAGAEGLRVDGDASMLDLWRTSARI